MNKSKKLSLCLCETNASFHILMVTLHKDKPFLQNAKNLCSCQLIKGQRGSCSFSLRESPACGVEFRVPGRTSECLAQSSSALVLPFSAFAACLRAAGLMWAFCKIPLLVPTLLFSAGQGAFTNGFCFPALDQMVQIHRFTDCTLLTLPLLCSSLEPSESRGPVQNPASPLQQLKN